VLDHSSDDPDIGSAISNITTMRFLEGSWLLVLSHRSYVSQLLVFNTLLPQQDPRSWRILGLPTLFGPYPDYHIFTQCEKLPTDYPEFSVDPAQRIFVLVCHLERAFAVPVESLIRHMHHERASPWMSWNEWGEDAIDVHLPPDTRTVQLYDTKVLSLCNSGYSEIWDVLTYDLRKSGHRDIQVQQVDEEADAGCRRVLSTPKQLARCEVRDRNFSVAHLVGNQVFGFIVSPVYVQKPSCHIQGYTTQNLPSIPSDRHRVHIWKIGQM
jgi:hypothetical protein